MKPALLLELAARWERDAQSPNCVNGAPEAVEANAKDAGAREAKRECADDLRMLVHLLG